MATDNNPGSGEPNTYLVIGANGFVGSHLVDQLAKLPGAKVVAFDRFSRASVFAQQPNVEIVKGDFFSKEDLGGALESADCVVHCLSLSTPASSVNNSGLDAQMVKRSAQIFESCAKNKVKKIAFVSSADVYGPTAQAKVATEDDTPQPANPYAQGKLASEQLLESLHSRTGQDYVVLRLTNPYGPRQIFKNGQGVVPTFINNIKAGKAISVYGDGSASRDFVYIEDAAKMMIDAIINTGSHSLYNVGSGQQTTINQLIEALQKHMDQPISIEHVDTPVANSQHTRVSTERFINDFGKPELTTLDSGIAKTLVAG